MAVQNDAEGFKPCPFCGGTVLYMETWSRRAGEWEGKALTGCCGYTFIFLNVVGESKEETIAFYKRMWNKRPE